MSDYRQFGIKSAICVECADEICTENAHYLLDDDGTIAENERGDEMLFCEDCWAKGDKPERRWSGVI